MYIGKKNQDILDQPDGVDRRFKETIPFNVLEKEHVHVIGSMRSVFITQNSELAGVGSKIYSGCFILERSSLFLTVGSEYCMITCVSSCVNLGTLLKLPELPHL